MAGLLASYRFRRRLLRAGALLAVAAATAVVSVLYWNTGRTYDTPLSNEPAVLPEQRQNVRLGPAERDQALRTAARFVATAVSRDHVARSYELTHPELLQGLSRSKWGTGEIPVQYYPVAAARWKLDYQYADEIGLQVYVVPRHGKELLPMVFDMALKPVAAGGGRRWLVSSWVPRGGSGGQTAPSSSERLGVAAPAPGQKAPISSTWLFVPVFLIGGVLLVPVVLVLRDRRRSRRAEREHRAALEARARPPQAGS